MKVFKYETHLHTLEGSACGRSSGSDYIKPLFEAGYSGIFVTDHFSAETPLLHANTKPTGKQE